MNTDNQPILASLLYPPVGVGDVRSAEDTDGHELMEYFHDYQQTGETSTPTHDVRHDAPPAVVPLPGNVNLHSRPLHDQRGQRTQSTQGRSAPPDSGAVARRSPSPPNPAIPIPSSLSQLASQVIPGIDLPDMSTPELTAARDQALLFVDYGERGEMGGRRRKMPHERAGWKEMDEQPPGKKRRSRKNANAADVDADANAAVASLTGSANIAPDLTYGQGASPATSVEHAPQGADLRSLTELSKMALQGPSPTSQMQTQPTSQIDPTLAAAAQNAAAQEEDTSKLSRAEQNKRAQQAFRRRREEHMKKLEMDSAQLEATKRQLTEKDAALRDLLLAHEAIIIQNKALQTALSLLVPHSRASPLSTDGQVVVNEAVQSRADNRPSSDHMAEAFTLLEKQTRELAKQSRMKRE